MEAKQNGFFAFFKLFLDLITFLFVTGLILIFAVILLPFIVFVLVVNMLINGGAIDFKTGKAHKKRQATIIRLLQSKKAV